MASPPDSPPADISEYSPANTLIPFSQPLPLLRGPIRADPNSDEFTLAFNDPQSWASTYRACELQISQQCEAGVRIGCSIAASHRCKPPWWKLLLGSKQDLSERQRCEEREMEACVREAKERCRGYGKEKCSKGFLDSWVGVEGSKDLILGLNDVSKLVSCVNLGYRDFGVDLLRLQRPWVELKAQFDVSSCRGRDLLGPGDTNVDEFLKRLR